jgi:hypothetical protein
MKYYEYNSLRVNESRKSSSMHFSVFHTINTQLQPLRFAVHHETIADTVLIEYF